VITPLRDGGGIVTAKTCVGLWASHIQRAPRNIHTPCYFTPAMNTPPREPTTRALFYKPGMTTDHGNTLAMFRRVHWDLYTQLVSILETVNNRCVFNGYMFGHLDNSSGYNSLSAAEVLNRVEKSGLGDMLHITLALKRILTAGGLAQSIEKRLGFHPGFKSVSHWDCPEQDLSSYALKPIKLPKPGITETHGKTLSWLKNNDNRTWHELLTVVMTRSDVAWTIVTYFFGHTDEWVEDMAMQQHTNAKDGDTLLDMLGKAGLGDAIHMVIAIRRAGWGQLADKLVTALGLQQHRDYLLEYNYNKPPEDDFSPLVSAPRV